MFWFYDQVKRHTLTSRIGVVNIPLLLEIDNTFSPACFSKYHCDLNVHSSYRFSIYLLHYIFFDDSMFMLIFQD